VITSILGSRYSCGLFCFFFSGVYDLFHFGCVFSVLSNVALSALTVFICFHSRSSFTRLPPVGVMRHAIYGRGCVICQGFSSDPSLARACYLQPRASTAASKAVIPRRHSAGRSLLRRALQGPQEPDHHDARGALRGRQTLPVRRQDELFCEMLMILAAGSTMSSRTPHGRSSKTS